MKTSVVTIGWSDSGDGEGGSASVSTTNTDSPCDDITITTSNGRTTVAMPLSQSGNGTRILVLKETSNAAVALTWDASNAVGGPISVPCSISLPANTGNIYIGGNGATTIRGICR